MNKNVLIVLLLMCLAIAGFYIVYEKNGNAVVEEDEVSEIEVSDLVGQDDSMSVDSTVTAIEAVTDSPIAMYKKIVFGRDLPIRYVELPGYTYGFDESREYEIREIRRIHSADDVINDVVFKACVPYVFDPREEGESYGFYGYKDGDYRCWNFAINDRGEAVYLETFGMQVDWPKYSFAYDLNHYPYIYTRTKGGANFGPYSYYIGLDIETVTTKVIASWSRGGGNSTDIPGFARGDLGSLNPGLGLFQVWQADTETYLIYSSADPGEYDGEGSEIVIRPKHQNKKFFPELSAIQPFNYFGFDETYTKILITGSNNESYEYSFDTDTIRKINN